MDRDNESGVPTLFLVLWIYYTILNFGDGLVAGRIWLLASFVVADISGMELVKEWFPSGTVESGTPSRDLSSAGAKYRVHRMSVKMAHRSEA